MNINDMKIENHYDALARVREIQEGLKSQIEEVDTSPERPSKDVSIDAQGFIIDLEVIEDMLCDSEFPYVHSESWEREAEDIQSEICKLYNIKPV